MKEDQSLERSVPGNYCSILITFEPKICFCPCALTTHRCFDGEQSETALSWQHSRSSLPGHPWAASAWSVETASVLCHPSMSSRLHLAALQCHSPAVLSGLGALPAARTPLPSRLRAAAPRLRHRGPAARAHRSGTRARPGLTHCHKDIHAPKEERAGGASAGSSLAPHCCSHSLTLSEPLGRAVSNFLIPLPTFTMAKRHTCVES